MFYYMFGGQEGSVWIDMVSAIVFGFEIFWVDLKHVRNRATFVLKVELHPFPGISKLAYKLIYK